MDYELAAMGGPWRIGEHYITVRQWRKDFNPKFAEVASTLVWARFPDLPIEFVNHEAVERIASRIGRPVRVDRATMTGDRVKYGRVCVEVDLTKPLLSQFKIEGRTYYITFEGLHNICTECGKYGHSVKACPTLRTEVPATPSSSTPEPEAMKGPEKLYGEWMMVKPRNNKTSVHKTKEVPVKANKVTSTVPDNGGSRFAILGDESPQKEMEVEMELVSESGAQGTTGQQNDPADAFPVPTGTKPAAAAMQQEAGEGHRAMNIPPMVDKQRAELVDVPVTSSGTSVIFHAEHVTGAKMKLGLDPGKGGTQTKKNGSSSA
ncbi:unnamed protein product [Linum tenue]|nr:unnamed protein product [Linum tenue]